MSNASNNNEIDLLELLINFKNWIVTVLVGFAKFILALLAFIVKKWVFLLVSLCLSAGLSFILADIQEEQYYSDLVLKSNIVSNEDMISYLNKLENLTIGDNYKLLAGALNISLEDAGKIKGIKAYWFIDQDKDGIVDGVDLNNKYLRDTTVAKVDWKFGITASVSDPSVFTLLSAGLQHYVNQNKFFVDLNKLRLENLEESIEQTILEIGKLDSLQKKEYFTSDESLKLQEGQFVFTNDREVKLMHSDIMKLLTDKQYKEKQFKIHNEIISLLSDFTVNQKPENGLSYYAKKITPILLILAYLIAILLHFRKNISTYLSSVGKN